MSELKPIISLWYGRSQDEGTYTAHMTVSGLSSESQAQVAVNHMRTQFAGEELAHQDGPCAQTAQAMPASCGECGKKTSDGWALYCVACVEKAGLPAQAGPLLSEDEIKAEIYSRGQMVNGVKGDGFMQGARWGEQAVRAKMRMTAPMTDAQIAEFQDDGVFFQNCKHIVRDIEKFHGIVGKEGA